MGHEADRTRRRRSWLWLLAWPLLAIWLWAEAPRAFGTVLALVDSVRGEPGWMVYGLPPPVGDTGEREFGEKYRVHIRSLGGCVVSQSTRDYAASYNGVVRFVRSMPTTARLDEHVVLSLVTRAFGALGLTLALIAHRRRR